MRKMAVAGGLLIIVTACGAGMLPESTTTQPGLQSSTTTTTAIPGLAIAPEGGVDLYDRAAGSVLLTAVEGLAFPIIEVSGIWYRVIDTCGDEAWVRRDEVGLVYPSEPEQTGPGFDISQAVVVVDAGHGGRDLGAKGASGTWESHVNLEIAAVLRDRLATPNTVDWTTGTITPGDTYPAVREVWLTRDPAGPLAGDIEMGLAYRAELANGVGAHALVAIHNNTSPARTSSTPGTDVFYAVGTPGSDRLASLIHEEMIRGLSRLGAEFGRAKITGVKTRVYADTGEDFYGVLRRADAPGVIIEGLYISEPAEEGILLSQAGQEAYADAVYRGLVRFLTTDDTGSEIQEPVPFDGDVGTVTNTACEVPAQP